MASPFHSPPPAPPRDDTLRYIRQLEPQWNNKLIAASIAISLLGAFTSTQLMCQARTSYHLSAVLAWTILSSLTFGGCSVWALHEVAMLACELDLPIGVDPWLTTLSAVLATAFTFFALSSDLLLERYRKRKTKHRRKRSTKRRQSSTTKNMWSLLPSKRQHFGSHVAAEEELAEGTYQDDIENQDADQRRPLTSAIRLEENAVAEDDDEDPTDEDTTLVPTRSNLMDGPNDPTHSILKQTSRVSNTDTPAIPDVRTEAAMAISQQDPVLRPTLIERSDSTNSSAQSMSNASSFGLNSLVNVAWMSTSRPVQNVFVLTATTLWEGLTLKNAIKGFFWSLAITSMHYVGIAGLKIPQGYYTLSVPLFLASALISWVVCLVGCIFMEEMQTHLPQQVLFSVVATTGVAAMHFTGMRAVTFWSMDSPSENRGYPPELVVAVASIAIITCIAANGLLAHSATVSRNKLAEIVYTRKQLWRTIAQKENAEAAAAARSDFIASASHEIRTPLHHLQGYSDLLSRTELTEEGRMLLSAIQRATQTLSLITNNVLDWSRLEKDSDGVCRPVALDIRGIAENVINLLPNKDDEAEVELLVVVSPDVPKSLFLDETYIHRILMNILSNSTKFTRTGYISLVITMKDGKLITSVTDTGCGIPSVFVPRMFEPYSQAETLGKQRGTGLGLSIIKHLVAKMGGTIDATSKYAEDEGVNPDDSGTIFTITLPIQTVSASIHDISPPPDGTRKVAIFHAGSERARTGILQAWHDFGYSTDVCSLEVPALDLSGRGYNFIWVDVAALKNNSALLQALLALKDVKVLIPCDSPTSPRDIPALRTRPAHFVYLTKPLIWHTFAQTIATAAQPLTLTKGVRFANEVETFDAPVTPVTPVTALPLERIIERSFSSQSAPTLTATESASKGTILLVEDNPLNQKLGVRMLKSLGYTPLLASDGQQGILQLQIHDDTIDAILMDQNMPVKDGLTATKEIRAMEQAGLLGKVKGRRVIVAVTAVVSSESERLFDEAGADGFLPKPLSLKKLEEALERYLQKDATGEGTPSAGE